MMNDEITRTLKKYGRADVPTYLKEITFLRGLLAEAYTELSTIEAATLIPGGQDEIDGLLDLVRRIKAEVDGVRQEAAVDGIRSRLVGEGWVAPDKWYYCPYCGVEAPRPGLHKQGCPAHDKGGPR